MEGFFSQTKIVKCGVLQGSTLGPLLFLIHINDLANDLEKSIVHHLAGDTNLLYGNKNPSVISDVINSNPKLVTDWLRANELYLNESKTKLLLFRPINILNLTLSNINYAKWTFANSYKVCHVPLHWDWRNFILEQPNWGYSKKTQQN